MLMDQHRRVEEDRQHRPADREELRVHRRRQRADRAGREGRVHRQPPRLDDRCEPAPSRPQDGARRRQLAAVDRHPGRRPFHDRRPHAELHVRRQELELRGAAQHGGSVDVRRVRALPESAGFAAAAADADAGTAEPVPAVHDAARRAQPVPGLHVQHREAARADGGAPRRSARRPLREPGLGLLDRHQIHREDALS